MTIETSPKNDLWAFREGKKEISAAAFLDDLARTALELCSHPTHVQLGISALMRTGEFESGLADAGSPAQPFAESLTDAFAEAFLGQRSALSCVPNLLSKIRAAALPEYLQISPPEGFAYYALHPHDFVRMTEELAFKANSALVIGIRSIGTTLSAIVRAALRQKGTTTARITVRPGGHPYDRVTHLRPEQRATVQYSHSAGSDFLVVDEGPGRSGSSFLSVGETLLNLGVPRERIAFLGSRQVDGNQLCAQNGAARWSRFRFLWPRPWMYARFSDHIYIGGGRWRDVFCSHESEFPFCWPQMERLKFLSPDRQSIFKFEGFGRFGE